ncbi:MAG: flagellar motor switch protein FliM [Acidimicrobiia bacterium]|nr:flagellar motor switch protein FliM [Acidimicrobiia bacterium]
MNPPQLDRVLTQDEIDNVFRNLQSQRAMEDPAKKAQPYDFRRPDRIAKDQLRAIHVLHENFARSLASSLSAYLRAYVIVNLVSVEQLSFMEFSQCLPSPTIITSLGMHPFDGSAVLEMNPSLVFPIIEILLGGVPQVNPAKIEREVTEIEQTILDSIFRIILHDMKQAWEAVTTLNFDLQSIETEPQLLQILAPNEAVVAISMEVRIGESIGMMNIGIPSIIIKMLRQKFDQQWSVRKSESTEQEQDRILRLIRPAVMYLDSRLSGATISTEDLLKLEPGDVLKLDYSIDRPLQLVFNGVEKFTGHIVDTGKRRGFQLEELIRPGAG